MRNRFNNITSKEWLPFQKYWFIDQGGEETYRSNLRFFLRLDGSLPQNIFVGDKEGQKSIKKVAKSLNIKVFFPTKKKTPEIQLILIDIRRQEEKRSPCLSESKEGSLTFGGSALSKFNPPSLSFHYAP